MAKLPELDKKAIKRTKTLATTILERFKSYTLESSVTYSDHLINNPVEQNLFLKEFNEAVSCEDFDFMNDTRSKASKIYQILKFRGTKPFTYGDFCHVVRETVCIGDSEFTICRTFFVLFAHSAIKISFLDGFSDYGPKDEIICTLNEDLGDFSD